MKLALETRSPMDALADVLVLGRYAAPTRPAAELVALDKKLDGLRSEEPRLNSSHALLSRMPSSA